MYKYIACIIFFIFILMCCISDYRKRKIPNLYVLILLGCGLIFHPACNYIFAMIMLSVGFMSYFYNKLGAGDAKLIFVLSLFVNPGDEYDFLMLFSVTVFFFLGICIFLVYVYNGMYFQRVRNMLPAILKPVNGKLLRTLPFGIPICCAYVSYFFLLRLF